MINWAKLIENNPTELAMFAVKAISRDEMLKYYPQLRNEMRRRGVNELRRLARKALKRQGMLVELD